MERRILAELFVEDGRAIEMDKGTIDYAKDAIDYQCQECGISTGDMRILDNNDPEDAKASDLADKIFNSEENNSTFVYIVNIDSTVDCLTDIETKVFSTYEKAKAYFDECVADEKANNSLMKLDDKAIFDYDNYFSIYHDCYWAEDHYEITIEQRMVY